MKSGKRHMTEGIELPNQEKIRTLREKETYKYMGILEPDTIKQVELKDNIKKEYLRRTRKLIEDKTRSQELYQRNKYLGFALVRYSGPLLRRPKTNGLENNKTNDHAQGLASQRCRWLTICVKKRKRKRTCQDWRQRWRIETTAWRLHRKGQRKTDHSHQKQYWRHGDQQTGNNQKTKMGRKTTL